MKQMQKGFTLIELMIVVAIIGILAAIALPAYQDYIARTKISEPLVHLDAAKTSISDYAASNAKLPPSPASAGVSTPANAKYVSALVWNETNNRLEATLKEINTTVNTKIIAMKGVLNADMSVSWECQTDIAIAEYKYVPSNCRNQLN
jgi:type IV pilus assembly protein PilA